MSVCLSVVCLSVWFVCGLLCLACIGVGKDRKSVGAAQRVGRAPVSQQAADDMPSALTTALVS